MDLIRDSAFFTTLLHCVLAHSLPQIDYVAQNLGAYDIVSPIPGSGVLQTPYDKIPELVTQTMFVNPSWPSMPSLDKLVRKVEVKNSQLLSYKAERPGTPLKGIGLKYPLTMPRVKLNFIGQSGMLPVKNIENTPKPEPPSKVLKLSGLEISTTPDNNKILIGSTVLRNSIPLYKNIQTPSKPENLDQAGKPVLKPATRYQTILSSLFGLELPTTAAEYIPSSKPELPDLILNPTNSGHPSTNPGIVYRNYEAVRTDVPYTPTYGPDHSRIEGLKLANFDYLTKPGVNGVDFSAEKDVKYTPLNKSYVPTIAVPKLTDLDYPHKNGQNPLDIIQHTSPHKDDLSVGVLKATNFEYFPTKPLGRDENTKAIKLPPVPTTMPLLRRIQLALLNTVAGLPGGNPQALDSVRAR